MPDPFHYRAFGFRIESQFELPELNPAFGDVDSASSIQISCGQVPPELPGSFQVGPRAQVAGNEALIKIDGVAIFHVYAGRQVTVEPAAGSDPTSIRHFLLGLVFGVLFVQRGTLAMHASCIEVHGSGIAFFGRSGAGKSTLAAYLRRRGHRLLCDDACVVDETSNGMQTWNGIPQYKLWSESLEALGTPAVDLRCVQPELEKYYLPATAIELNRPVALRALYCVQPIEPDVNADIVPIGGLAALAVIRQNVHGQEFHIRINGEKKFLNRCMAIQRKLPVYSLPVPRDFRLLEETSARLEAHLAIHSSRADCV